MSESDEGLSVAATRQKEGNVPKARAAAGETLVGAANPPAATSSARVMLVCSSEAAARDSHEAAAPTVRTSTSAPRRLAQSPPAIDFMPPLLSAVVRRP